MATRNSDDLKKTEYIVVRESVNNTVQKTVVPKHFQIGLDDPQFKSHLAVYGGAIIKSGLTGSLQKLPDGTNYLRGDSNISITNNIDGSITIGTASGAFTGTTTNTLTAGNGLSLASGPFNGSVADTLAISLASSSGLGIASSQLKVDINALAEAVPAAGDFLIMRDATGGVLKKFNFASVSTAAQQAAVLNNKLSTTDGIEYTTGTDYDNSANRILKIKLASNSGLAFSSNSLIAKPSTATAKSGGAVSNDTILISDSAASDAVKKVTIGSLGIAASTLTSPLSPGTGLEFVTGAGSYNNTSAQTVRVKTSGSTITSTSSGVSVASVPGTLSAGTGLSSFSFNGSSNTAISVDASSVATFTAGGTFNGNVTFAGNVYGKFNEVAAGTPSLVAGSNVSISTAVNGQTTINASNTVDVAALSSGSPARSDLMLVEQGGTNKKTTVSAIADLVDKSTLVLGSDTITATTPNAATAATLSVKVANNTIGTTTSGIHVQSVPSSITDGVGILDFAYDGSSARMVTIDNSTVATLTGSNFTGNVRFNTGISGSLQTLTDGRPYMVGGTGIMITTSSIGQVILTNTFDPIVNIAADDLIAGDGPVGLRTSTGDIVIKTPDNILFTAAQSIFSGSVKAIHGLTGSLQKLTNGNPYLRSGNNVSITTGSDGAVTISVENVRDKDVYSLSATNALTNIPVAGSDLSTVAYDPHLIDIFLNGILLYSGSSNQVSNSQADYYLTGPSSLQFSFAVEANDLLGVVINTASGGGGTGGAAADAPYITFEAHSILENERVLRVSEFMSLTTGSAGFIDFDVRRKKIMIPITNTLTTGNPLNSGFDFSKVTYDPERIDVFVNGVLLLTGSSYDYSLRPVSNIIFGFDLFVDDHVTINII